MKRLLFMLAGWLLMLSPLYAQRQSYVDWKNQDMDSLLIWFKDGTPKDLSRLKDLEFKRSHVRPRAVIVDKATQLDTSIDPRRSVFANLPIGSDDLLTGLPSGTFDEDVFSAWSYVKVHGNWSNPWFTAPAAYSDAAHKHGTAVLSSWFFAWDWLYVKGKSKAEDGNAYKIELMTKKDGQGNFIYAEPMMNIMQYFGMDGINYNSECFFRGASADMQSLHKKLYDLAAERNFSTFHVGWYNSVSNDGTAHGGRSLLNNTNDKWHYNNGKFVSDAFMLDYNWGASSLGTTTTTAQSIGAPNGAQDVYAGMWLVSMGSTYYAALDQYKNVGIGLWGEHKNNRFFNHRSGDDLAGVQKSYQDRLEWFFSGKTQNPLDAKTNTLITSADGTSVESDSYLKAFHGIAKHVAERSTVQGSLPFATNFNLGNGLYYYDRSVKTHGNWYNLSAQDMIPTYRWLITNQSGASATNVKARFSHENAWVGGSSLLLEGTAQVTPTDITLYRTKLSPKKNNAYSTKPATPIDFTVDTLEESDCATQVDLKMVWSMHADNRTRLVYNDEVNVDHFEIWIRESGKEEKMVAHTASWAHYLSKYEWEDAGSTTLEVGVRAVAQDLATTSDMAWRTVYRGSPKPGASCGGRTYCEAVNDLGQAADAHLKRYFDSAYTVGADVNIKVHGQPPTKSGLEGYASFQSDVIEVTPGKTFTFRAEAVNLAPGQTKDPYSLQWDKYRVYVDWNSDGAFDAATELIHSGGKDGAGDISVCHLNFNVAVPANATPGLTCMRIRYADAWVAHPGACGKASGGYTADFAIRIAGEVNGGEDTETSEERPDFNGPTLDAAFPSAYLVYKLEGGAAGSASNLALLLKKKGAAEPVVYPLGNVTLEGWNEANIPLTDYAEADTIVSVGLRVQAATETPIKVYIGELKLLPGSYRPQKVKVSVVPVVTDFTITSPISVDGTDTLVKYSDPLAFTFKLSASELVPSVKINGTPVSYSYESGKGVYAVSLPSVMEDLSIAITTAVPRTVAVNKPAEITIVSANAAEATAGQYKLANGSAFTLTFQVKGEGYDVPTVTTGSVPYTLAPAVGGVYTVTIAAVDADTSINITVALQKFTVSVTAGSHVTLQTAVSEQVEWGKSNEVRFTLEVGYNPVVKINNVDQPAPTAGEGGVYTVTVPNITANVSVDVSAVIQKFDVTITKDANIVFGSGTTAGTKQVDYGSSFAFSFEVATDGYEPVVEVNSTRVDPGTPNDGLYSYTVTNITAATTISVTAKQREADKVNVNLSKGDNVTLGAGVTEGLAEVTSGGDFVFSFTVATGYEPVLKVSNVEVTLGAPDNTGLYSHTVTNITAATTISITAKLRQFDVTLTTTSNVTLGSGTTAGTKQVNYGGDFAFSFTVPTGHNPVLTVNGAPVTLGAPDANGYYSHTVTNITAATAISIAAQLQRFDVTLTTTSNVTLGSGTTAGTKQVNYGGDFAFSFTVPTGYNPVLTVNGAPVTLGAPDANGYYSHTVTNITAATAISIAAQLRQFGVTLTTTSNVTLGSGTTAGTKQVNYGGDFAFSFTVPTGNNPVLTVNGAPVTLGAPDANGYYSHTVTNITAATAISIAAQ
jgi:endo-beta-N-acetylglucosaminidase D